MSTPSIQTLIAQAQQVLNLKSSNEIRATLAAILANANVGTPLNPNLTTQQLWDEFYEIVRQPSDDIMSIIVDQMMRMVFSPPAPGGAGADKQVIFNDGGVLAGDAGLMYNKATDALTITGDLTVDTNVLKVDSANDRVGVGTTSLSEKLNVAGNISANAWLGRGNIAAPSGDCSIFRSADNTLGFGIASTTAMTLNATGLGIGIAGASIAGKLDVDVGAGGFGYFRSTTYSNFQINGRSGGAGSGGCQLFLTTTGSRSWLVGQRTDTAYGAANSFFIRDDTANATRLEIDTSGNVGIGVTPYASWPATSKALQLGASSVIEGRTNDGSRTSVYTNAVWNGTNLIYQNTAAASYYSQLSGVHSWHTAPSGTAGASAAVTSGQSYTVSVLGSSTLAQWQAFFSALTVLPTVGQVITATATGSIVGGGTVTQNITFTQALTLDASGNLLAGATTNTNVSRIFSRGTATSSALALQGASGDVALAQLTVGKFDNNTTTSQIFVRFTINDNSGGSGQINANGASQAAFGSFSDSRLKENILSLPSQLANILSLRPVEFDYKDGSGHQIGFIAQEMREVYSDTVSEQDGFLTVTGWSKTEARLVSAIKELAAKVQALETKLA